MQNLIFKGLNGEFKIAAATQYITRSKIRLKTEQKLAGKTAASHRNFAQLGHKNLIFACFKCSFVDFFLLIYEWTQAQVIKLFY